MLSIKILWFWIVAFSVLVWNTIKGNNWNMAYVDFHLGDRPDGRPIRKQLVAKMRGSGRLEIYWQDLSAYFDNK